MGDSQGRVASLLRERRKLGQNVLFAAAQDERNNLLPQRGQVLVTHNLAGLVLLMKFQVEFPERAQHICVDDLHRLAPRRRQRTQGKRHPLVPRVDALPVGVPAPARPAA